MPKHKKPSIFYWVEVFLLVLFLYAIIQIVYISATTQLSPSVAIAAITAPLPLIREWYRYNDNKYMRKKNAQQPDKK